MKKIVRYSAQLLLLVFLGAGGPLLGDNSSEDIIDFFDNHFENAELLENTSFSLERSCDKQSILFIIDDFKILQLLATDFFLRSNPVQTRSLLDYPEFLPWRHEKDAHAFGIDFFYNQTTRGFFTRDSSNICSYLALSQESNFIQELQQLFIRIRDTLGIPLETDKFLPVLNLFETFTVQERRLGAMFHYKGTLGEWNLYGYAPWYYIERNHFVNEAIQEELDTILTDLFGPTSECDRATFQDAHFISDQFGVGDTRIYADYPIIDKIKWSLRAGPSVTLPTAGAFTKGLKGTTFKRFGVCRPLLPLCDIADQALAEVDISEIEGFDYFLDVLDNLSAMLLNTSMGNGGHVGLGIFMRNTIPVSEYISERWARKLLLRSFTSLEYLIPAWETRSFRIPADAAFVTSIPLTNLTPPQVDRSFDLILQELTNRLIPIGLETKVHPGIIFHSSTNVSYEGKRSGFSFGTDTWLKTPEHLKKIQACKEVLDIIDQCNASSGFAYQSKLFGSIFFKVKKPNHFWTFMLAADTTFMNRGIGEDYTVTFGIDVIF